MSYGYMNLYDENEVILENVLPVVPSKDGYLRENSILPIGYINNEGTILYNLNGLATHFVEEISKEIEEEDIEPVFRILGEI